MTLKFNKYIIKNIPYLINIIRDWNNVNNFFTRFIDFVFNNLEKPLKLTASRVLVNDDRFDDDDEHDSTLSSLSVLIELEKKKIEIE